MDQNTILVLNLDSDKIKRLSSFEYEYWLSVKKEVTFSLNNKDCGCLIRVKQQTGTKNWS